MKPTMILLYCLCIFLTSCSRTENTNANLPKSNKGKVMSKNEIENKQSLKKNELEKQFRWALVQWKQHLNKPEVQVSSFSEAKFDCKAYRKIIALGRPVLPLIMNEMRNGNNLLVYAVRDITGMDFSQIEKMVDLDRLQEKGSHVDESRQRPDDLVRFVRFIAACYFYYEVNDSFPDSVSILKAFCVDNNLACRKSDWSKFTCQKLKGDELAIEYESEQGPVSILLDISQHQIEDYESLKEHMENEIRQKLETLETEN